MDVFFNGSFWENPADETPCRPVAVNKQFDWNGYTWLIPAVYVCRQGLVMDLLKQVPLPELKAYAEKWKDREEEPEQQAFAEYENPMSGHLDLKLRVRGAEIRSSRSCSTRWQPFGDRRESASQEARELMEAYNCKESHGWQFNRAFFRWDFEEMPENIGLELKLKPHMLPCPEHFTVKADSAEQTVAFTHPITGSRHFLVVREAVREMLADFEDDDIFTYPRCCLRLTYCFGHRDEYEQFWPRDCDSGDSPRRNGTKAEAETLLVSSVAAVGILEGGDTGERTVFSALHFEPVEQVRCRIDACAAAGEKMELSLDIASI